MSAYTRDILELNGMMKNLTMMLSKQSDDINDIGQKSHRHAHAVIYVGLALYNHAYIEKHVTDSQKNTEKGCKSTEQQVRGYNVYTKIRLRLHIASSGLPVRWVKLTRLVASAIFSFWLSAGSVCSSQCRIHVILCSMCQQNV